MKETFVYQLVKTFYSVGMMRDGRYVHYDLPSSRQEAGEIYRTEAAAKKALKKEYEAAKKRSAEEAALMGRDPGEEYCSFDGENGEFKAYMQTGRITGFISKKKVN